MGDSEVVVLIVLAPSGEPSVLAFYTSDLRRLMQGSEVLSSPLITRQSIHSMLVKMRVDFSYQPSAAIAIGVAGRAPLRLSKNKNHILYLAVFANSIIRV